MYFGEPYHQYSPIKTKLVATSISPMKRQFSNMGVSKPCGDTSSMERSSANVGSLSSAIADIEIYKEQGFSHAIDKFSSLKRTIHDETTPSSAHTRPSNSSAMHHNAASRSPWRRESDPYT